MEVEDYIEIWKDSGINDLESYTKLTPEAARELKEKIHGK